MTQNIKQSVSSKVGLLTVIAIFIALLAYANFYAFKTVAPGIAANESTSRQQNKLTESTFEQQNNKLIESTSQQQNKLTESISVTMVEEVKTSQNAVAQSVDMDDSKVEAVNANTGIEPVVQSVQEVLPVIAVQPDDNRLHQDFSANNQSGSSFINQYDQYATGNYRGYGRSTGALKGDGEFKFSMKFKSRARMNADTEMNSQLHNANSYYAYQGMYDQGYYQNAGYTNFQQQ